MKPIIPKEKIDTNISFSDCVDSVRFEVEDALQRFPESKELFLHQVRLILEKLEQE
jgi:hypothetical protein